MPSISFLPLTNLGSAMPWGLWISVYVWLIGISTGSFLLVCLSSLLKSDSLKSGRQQFLLLALCALGGALLCVNLDLGHIERSFELFTALNPVSPMSWMGKLYPLYALMLLILIFRRDVPLSRPVAIAGIIFALVLIVVESLLFAMPPGKAWHSPIAPVHFITISIASAVFAISLVFRWMVSDPEKTAGAESFARGATLLLALFIVVEITEIILSGGAGHLTHWAGVLVTLLAMLMYLRTPFSTLASITGLVGTGLAKYFSIVSAQYHQPFVGFSGAYTEPKVLFAYAPSGFELFAALAIIAGCVVGLFILNKVVPSLPGRTNK